MTDAPAEPVRYRMPIVRAVTGADVRAALSAGLDDFRRAPAFGLLFGGLYAGGGLLLVGLVTVLHLAYLAYPLAAGFTLIGPFVAVGLYEVSRRLETGAPLSFSTVLGVMFAQRKREFAWLAFVTLFIFIIWMYQVRLLLALFLGFHSFTSMPEFIGVIFGTVDGLLFLAVGHVVGAFLSVAVFSLTIVSFPLLLDRDVDFITAMITSVQVVTTSPVPMLAWALVVVLSLVVAVVPMFLGFVFVLPVLGHTTWHLFRRAVAPDA